LQWAHTPITYLQAGANGFILKVPFERNGYSSTAIIKSSLSQKSDNLLYEAFTGKIINEFSLQFPCFVQTYGFGFYDNAKLIMLSGNITDGKLNIGVKEVDPLFLKSLNIAPIQNLSIDPIESLAKISCIFAKYAFVMTEYVENFIGFKKAMESFSESRDSKIQRQFWNINIFTILYQIYSVLDTLKTQFTHYDLHYQNVLLFVPSKQENEYIKMCYHYQSGEVVEFKTQYVVKIIDYGRSYVFRNSQENSTVWKEKVCKDTVNCKERCGRTRGYFFNDGLYYINASKSNVSHDLRLFKQVTNKFFKFSKTNPDIANESPMTQIGGKLKYSMGLNKNSDEFNLNGQFDEETFKIFDSYGTAPIEQGMFPGSILNVTDAHKMFKNVVLTLDFREFQSKVCIGTTHVWLFGNTPTTFEPA
jgi:hypothetical protein